MEYIICLKIAKHKNGGTHYFSADIGREKERKGKEKAGGKLTSGFF